MPDTPPKDLFDTFLQRLTQTGAEVDTLMAQIPDLERLSKATFVLLWQAIYDAMLEKKSDELLKFGALAEKLYGAITDRKIADVRVETLTKENATPAKPNSPTASDYTDLQNKMKIL